MIELLEFIVFIGFVELLGFVEMAGLLRPDESRLTMTCKKESLGFMVIIGLLHPPLNPLPSRERKTVVNKSQIALSR